MYDLIILGSGPGGYVTAAKAGQAGLKVLVIEKDELGGICLNTGCIPTKAVLASAKQYLDMLDAKSHGITIDGTVSYNWQEMIARKDKVVSRLTKGIQSLFKLSKVEWVQGTGEVLSPTEVKVGSETYQTKHLIIATGAKPRIPDIPGLKDLFDSGKAKTSTQMLTVENVPEKLVILGDNVFAVEYASLFSALGVAVTILAPSERILPYMDEELSSFLTKELARQKVDIITQAKALNLSDSEVTYQTKDKTDTKAFDLVLVSLGAEPNVTGLQALKFKTTDQGFIETNEYLQTSIPGVYAIGDVIGKYPLAHVASAEGLVALDHILGKSRAMNYHKLPMAVYSYPEVASVGLTEAKAREVYGDVVVSKYFMSANGKALAEGDSKGFVKILSIPPYNEVVGLHLAGNKATDLIAEGVLALQLEATLADLAQAIHAHPTPSEIIMEAAASI